MPVPSRSLSLCEVPVGHRPRPGDRDTAVADRPGPTKPLARTTATSASAGARGIPSHTKSVSVKASAPGSTENSTTNSMRSTTSGRSLLPQPRTLRAETISGPLQSRQERRSGKRLVQQEQDGPHREPRATPRPKSLVHPAENVKGSPAGTRSGLSLQTPKSSSIRPEQRTPATTRLERSASLRQPTTPKPSPVSHTRHRSQVIFSKANPIQASNGPSTPSSLRSPIKQSFTTPQQHYSPRKLSQPPTLNTSTFANNDNAPLPSHITSLQAELLQLQLLHPQALRAKAKWEKNNEQHFRGLHESAAENYRAVIKAEKSIQQRLNVRAIDQWWRDVKNKKGRYGFAEQIQTLSRVLQDATDLTSLRDGTYTLTLRQFEEWFDHAMNVRENRARQRKSLGDEGTIPDMEFIDPLDLEWKENIEMLTVKVELCSRELDCLDVGLDVREGDQDYSASALFRILKGHRMLLASMLDELQTVARLEAELLDWERAWVKSAVDDLGSVISRAPLQHRPIWERT